MCDNNEINHVHEHRFVLPFLRMIKFSYNVNIVCIFVGTWIASGIAYVRVFVCSLCVCLCVCVCV